MVTTESKTLNRVTSKPTPSIQEARALSPIPQMILRSASDFPERTALRMNQGREGDWRTYTYDQLVYEASQLANELQSLGLQKGDRAGLVGENCPEWVIGYLAVLWAGGIVVPLDARLTRHERTYLLGTAAANLLIATGKFAIEAKETGSEIEGLAVVGLKEDGDHEFFDKSGRRHVAGEAISSSPSCELDEIAEILFTSGTTGDAKGVMLSHRNIVSNLESVRQFIHFDEKDNFFSVLPLHHVFESTIGMLAPLSCGGSITYARSLKPNEIREDLAASRATVLLAVPLLLEKVLKGIHRGVKQAPLPRRAMFHALLGASKLAGKVVKGHGSKTFMRTIRKKAGMDTLRFIVSGAAALPDNVSKGLEELGFPLLQGYGLSECSPVLSCNPLGAARNSSVGLPLPDIEIAIEGEAGMPGEILARGPNIMLGYYKNPEATSEILDEEGWLHTGDLGYLDEEGYLHITGRKKSVIVTPGGKNIYPEEIEAHLAESPFIEEVLIVPMSNDRSADANIEAIIFPCLEEIEASRPKSTVEASASSDGGSETVSSEEIRAAVEGEVKRITALMADYKRPRKITIRDEEFPKTTTKKIKRYLFTGQ